MKKSLTTAALFLSLLGAPARAAAPMPDPYQLSLMIYGALTALDQANTTGNYTVLRGLAAPAFQSLNTPEALAAAFAKYRRAHVSLAPVVLFQPTLTDEASIGADGLLHLKGYFATRLLRIGFELAFQDVNGTWRLMTLSVKPSEA